MIKLGTKDLSVDTVNHLSDLQKQVDNPALDREAKVKLATDLWKNKEKGKGREAFKEIRAKLDELHSHKNVCNYCEWTEKRDIEHFFTKKHFPGKTFLWENYLQVCTICNSDYKGEKFAVFIAGDEIKHLPNKKKEYSAPPSEDNVLINPRVEDPFDYLMIDFQTGAFLAKPGMVSRKIEKAKYTYETLGLNTRDVLVRGRKKAAQNYRDKLQKYALITEAFNFEQLQAVVSNEFNLTLDPTKDFLAEKARLKDYFKNDILDDPFPSVWLQLKHQRDFDPAIDLLFNQVPETLGW